MPLSAAFVRFRRLLAFLLAWGAVAVECRGDPTQYFAYFTILTNLGIGAWFLMAACSPRRAERMPGVRLSLTVYGFVTVLVYWVFLSPDHHPQGWSFAANLLLHLGVPLAMAAEDLLIPWPRLRALEVLWCLLFPVVYGVGTLTRGAMTGWYPYFFLDGTKRGGGQLAAFLGLLLLLFVGLSYSWRVLVELRYRKATAR
jgi:hypothetical protein